MKGAGTNGRGGAGALLLHTQGRALAHGVEDLAALQARTADRLTRCLTH